jgi:hypothetical protein
MIKGFGLGAAVALAAAAAVAADAPLQVSYPGDAGMACPAIAAESARMDQVIYASNAEINKAEGGARGAGMASSVAVEGMLRTGVLGRVPGAGLFANNAAAMARQRAEAVKAQAAERIQTANTRKAMLAGLYAGKNCDAPPAPVAETPPSETTPVQAEPAAATAPSGEASAAPAGG